MKLYLAGPLFTTPERTWNEALAARLEAAGHEVYVPHLHPAAVKTPRRSSATTSGAWTGPTRS